MELWLDSHDAAHFFGCKTLGMEKQQTVQPEDIVFDYTRASDTLNDLTLDAFFSQNTIPSVRTYPSIETFKSGFVSMNEKLFKSMKERHDKSQGSERCLEKNHLAILDKKKVSRRLKRMLRRSAMKYCHSQSIIRLLRSYFVLVEYHHRVVNSHPQIMDRYLRTIFAVFGSVRREKMQEMLREICSCPKMEGFYLDLYGLWEGEAGSVEREYLFGYK